MPTDCAIARLSTAARTIAPQRVRSTPNHSPQNDQEAENNDEHPVGREVAAEHVHLAAQVVGQEHGRRERRRRSARATATDMKMRPMVKSTCASSPAL